MTLRGLSSRGGPFSRRRPLNGAFDVRFIASTAQRLLLPICFLVLSAVRLATIVHTPIAYDGRLYWAATAAWLAGGDPWQVQAGGVYFAAPPPTLLVMIPLALIPETLAAAILLAGGLAATVWAIRRLHLPLWWLAFPPLVDGLYNANPHVFVLPLALSGIAWVGPLVKVYAAPVLLLQQQFRALLVAGAVVLLTAPILPWARFLEELPRITWLLDVQSSGGLSVLAAPILVIPAVAALWLVGRERAAWWVVPVLWPATQYYYASTAIPALTPIAALVLCAQFPGVASVAVIVSVVELWWARRTRQDGSRIDTG